MKIPEPPPDQWDWSMTDTALAEMYGYAGRSSVRYWRVKLGHPPSPSRSLPRPGLRREKTCLRCGAPYWGRNHGYCSRECGEAARADHLSRMGDTVDRLRAGLAASPICQPTPDNHAARGYSLMSPDGTVFCGKNLANFVRENEHLFAREDVESKSSNPTTYACLATIGLGQLRPWRKNKKLPKSWKGWTWHNV